MINEFNELKNFILSFNIFEDNQFLDEYCNLILLNLTKEKIKYKTQRHHFIPVCYYKYTYKLSRKDAIIYSEQHNNFCVNLLYTDHILAHYYLCLAVKDHKHIKYRLYNTLRIMLSRNSNQHLKLDCNEILNQIKELDLSKVQQIYEEHSRLSAELNCGENNGMYGKHHTKEWKEMSQSLKGRKMSEDFRKKNSERNKGEGNPMWGRHFIFLNDGVRNYKWDLSKPIPEHLNKGRIKVKKKD